MNASPRSGVADYGAIFEQLRARNLRRSILGVTVVLAMALVVASTDALQVQTWFDMPRALVALVGDALPPDASRWRQWVRPLGTTLAMSAGGTIISFALSLPLGVLSARNVAPRALSRGCRSLLDVLRSIPCVIWGIGFVAAVGFGSTAGVLALAAHSTGMLGKFFAEIVEHVDPAPGDVLRSQGVPTLGVLRFAVWPQVVPRIADVTLYRFEHNLRSATTLGAVGVGGLGQEIVTAFHLFEYREACALIMVMLALVAVIDALGALIRHRLIEGEAG